MSRFHAEVLPANQRAVLEALGSFASSRGFYLAGGTAVALHLGHRSSVDLDWFGESEPADPMALLGALREAVPAVEPCPSAPGTLYARVRGVSVSFLRYRYPLMGPKVAWSEVGCELAPLGDLAAMKLVAIAQRGARRDFVDVAALLAHGLPLSQMLDLYRAKYGTDEVLPVLTGLSYFDDAEAEPQPAMLDGSNWATVKARLRQAVRQYVGPA